MVVLEAPKRDSRGRIVNEGGCGGPGCRQGAAPPAGRGQQGCRGGAQAQSGSGPAGGGGRAGQFRGEARPKVPPQRKGCFPGGTGGPAASVPPKEPAHRSKLTRPGTRMETGSAMPRTEFDRPDPSPETISWTPPPVCWPPQARFGSGEPPGGQPPLSPPEPEARRARRNSPSGSRQDGGPSERQGRPQRSFRPENRAHGRAAPAARTAAVPQWAPRPHRAYEVQPDQGLHRAAQSDEALLFR